MMFQNTFGMSSVMHHRLESILTPTLEINILVVVSGNHINIFKHLTLSNHFFILCMIGKFCVSQWDLYSTQNHVSQQQNSKGLSSPERYIAP